MEKSSYNPDVLNCLANLSNDEVFTPPALATQMIDLLPAELFRSPDTRFLDPFSKSGVFLREIVKRLDRGLQDAILDRQQRIDHILHHQVFGIAITELTAHLSRRTLYCSKDASGKYSVSHFDSSEGNLLYTPLRHTWGGNDKCIYCGASRSVYDRDDAAEQYAYQFIHTDNPQKIFPNMKFDVIIGNPPYQLSDGGGLQTDSSSGSAIPQYHKFVIQAQKLSPRYLIMIIPARWYAGGRNLDEFRDMMLKDYRLEKIVDYSDSRDCFPGVDIAGGVCYFLWNREKQKKTCDIVNVTQQQSDEMSRMLNQYPVFIRSNKSIHIIDKIRSHKEKTFDNIVYSSKPFGFRSFYKGKEKAFANSVVLFGSSGLSFVDRADVTVNSDLIDEWKVIVSKTSAEHAGQADKDGRKKILSRVEILEPGVVCSESYLLVATFEDKRSCENLVAYLKTEFCRFMLSLVVITQNMSKASFQFLPIQDFSHPWTDEMLYKKYGLEQKEIDFIESMIRPME